MQGPFIRRIIGAVVITTAIGTLSSSTAQNLSIKTDRASINGGRADFGGPGHTFGGPLDGYVTWGLSTVNGSLVASAEVRGQLYWDALNSGCAGLDIKFMNSGSSGLAPLNSHRTAKVCGPGGNANDSHNHIDIDETYANSDLGSVVIQTCVWATSYLCIPDGKSAGVITYQADDNSLKVDAPPNSKKYDVNINNGNADFGAGFHAGGGPTGSGLVKLTYDKVGNVTGVVDGTLYWDSLFAGGCSQLIIDFQNSNGTTLNSEKIEECGAGGNANDAGNKKTVSKSFSRGSLMKIQLRVGVLLPDGSFQNVKKKLCDFKECKDL